MIQWLYSLPAVTIWRRAEGLEAHACPQKPAAGHTRSSDQRMGLEFTKHHKHWSPSSPGLQTTQNALNVSTTKAISTSTFFPSFIKNTEDARKIFPSFLPSFWFQASFCCSFQHATEANIPPWPNEIHFFFCVVLQQVLNALHNSRWEFSSFPERGSSWFWAPGLLEWYGSESHNFLQRTTKWRSFLCVFRIHIILIFLSTWSLLENGP